LRHGLEGKRVGGAMEGKERMKKKEKDSRWEESGGEGSNGSDQV